MTFCCCFVHEILGNLNTHFWINISVHGTCSLYFTLGTCSYYLVSKLHIPSTIIKELVCFCCGKYFILNCSGVEV